MLNISAVVMASGMSKRMKRCKLHMKINNKNIYEYILETIRECNFYEVIVVAKDEDILKEAKSLGYLGVKNNRYFVGQSESVKIALRNLNTAAGYMFFVADQPFIKEKTINRLCLTFLKKPTSIIVPYYNGRKGSPVIFPHSFKDQLLALEKDQGGTVIINKNKSRVLPVPIQTEYENLDIDTIEDYERAKSIFTNK